MFKIMLGSRYDLSFNFYIYSRKKKSLFFDCDVINLKIIKNVMFAFYNIYSFSISKQNNQK